jgi:hypothetical protein
LDFGSLCCVPLCFLALAAPVVQHQFLRLTYFDVHRVCYFVLQHH